MSKVALFTLGLAVLLSARDLRSEVPIVGITASSVQAPYFLSNLTDGNPHTHFSSLVGPSPTTNEWIVIDLGQKQYSLVGISLTGKNRGFGFPINFDILGSNDGSSWAPVVGGGFREFSNPASATVTIPFGYSVNYRFLKLNVEKLGNTYDGNYALELAEVEVHRKYVATASSVIGSLVADYAIDGRWDPGQFYSSVGYGTPYHTEWFQVELGAVTNNILQVNLTPRPGGLGFPVDFKIQYRLDPFSGWIDAPGGSRSNFSALDGKMVPIRFSNPVSARQIRLIATRLGGDNYGNYYLQLVEFEHETEDYPLAEPHSISASTSLPGWNPEYLLDRNSSSVWSSSLQANENSIQWVTLQYQESTAIHKVHVDPRPDGIAFPRDFQIESSLDGQSFQPIAGQTYLNYPNPGSTRQTFEFDPVVVKALRIKATKLTPDPHGGLYFQLANVIPVAWDTMADTWTATDALQRRLLLPPLQSTAKTDKHVGILYALWHGHHGTPGPYNIASIIASTPGAMQIETSPPWGPPGSIHFWGEPLFGYYLSQDPFIIRKHAQMLSDAGMDVAFLEATNGFSYTQEYFDLLEEFTDVRHKGSRTPQVSFLSPFHTPCTVVPGLFSNLYEPQLFRDLWFTWEDDKPLILTNPAHYHSGFGCPSQAILDFFSFRLPRPELMVQPSGPNQWAWLQGYPQSIFYSHNNAVEQISVGVAQNVEPDGMGGWVLAPFSLETSRGRSFRDVDFSLPIDSEIGTNFMEQWGRALEVSPEFVFVTQWNEWWALRLGLSGDDDVNWPWPGNNLFFDQFTQEFSRDIEPMKGGHSDSFYYQLVDYVRRYKGQRRLQNPGERTTIQIDGSFEDWKIVQQEFRDDIGDPSARNFPGWGSAGPYINLTGRNDLQLMKVARDESYVYFYLKTHQPITSYMDPAWLRLFISVPQASLPNSWSGYHFVINRLQGTASHLVLEVAAGAGWNWTAISSNIPYSVSGREMELAVPRSLLGLSDATAPIYLEFKWHDNMQIQGDVMEFTKNGDAAPNGRFNYIYTESSW